MSSKWIGCVYIIRVEINCVSLYLILMCCFGSYGMRARISNSSVLKNRSQTCFSFFLGEFFTSLPSCNSWTFEIWRDCVVYLLLFLFSFNCGYSALNSITTIWPSQFRYLFSFACIACVLFMKLDGNSSLEWHTNGCQKLFK